MYSSEFQVAGSVAAFRYRWCGYRSLAQMSALAPDKSRLVSSIAETLKRKRAASVSLLATWYLGYPNGSTLASSATKELCSECLIRMRLAIEVEADASGAATRCSSGCLTGCVGVSTMALVGDAMVPGIIQLERGSCRVLSNKW